MPYRRWKGNINRAILDAASSFNNLGKIAEEYLTNSLDAFETVLHDNPKNEIKRADCKIQFIIDHSKNKILFKDEHELLGMPSNIVYNNFFRIHTITISRRRFINVRGKHGTGKSAAFGIEARYLLVDTIYEGKRTTVKSTYDSLKKEDDEEAPSFKTFAYTMAIDEYARAVVNIMAANHEFYGGSMEEILQEGVTEMGIIKKRVLDKLSNVVSG